MSPVGEKLHLSSEFHVADIMVARRHEAAPVLNQKEVLTRCKPEDVFPDCAEIFKDDVALYLLSHEPTQLNDDPVDAIGAVSIDAEGTATLKVDFPSTTSLPTREEFVKKATRDIAENAPVTQIIVEKPDEEHEGSVIQELFSSARLAA